jgi:MFS transporter, DHA2 family, multidrug resistance protein
LVTGAAVQEKVSVATWVGYIALCIGMFMAVLDIQIVASSLPDIQAGLAIRHEDLSWIQTAYLIAEIIAIPLTGWLTRLLSIRGLFLFAVGGFTLASAACAVSTGFASLILSRVVQGFCGGAIIPTVFTAVFLLFPVREQTRATVIGGAFAMLAPTLGPTLGGYITATFSWHWLFLINLLPGILVAIAARLALPSSAVDWPLLRRLDYLSLALLAVSLASLELMLKDGPTRGWGDARVLIELLLCLGAGAWLGRRSLAHERPMIDLRLFADRGFSIGCAYSCVLGAGLYGSVYLLPLFLGYVRDHTALQIGLVMLVTGAAQLVTAPIAAPVERLLDRRLLTAIGYSLFAAGLISNGFMTYQTDFDGLFWPQVLRGVAVLLCLLPTTSLALETLPQDRVADGSGLFNLMRNLGGAIAIAVVDTILHLRPAAHVERLVERLKAGDAQAAIEVGIPLERFLNAPTREVDEATRELLRPLVERAAAVGSFNDAWLLLGVVFLLSLVLLPWLKQTGEHRE